MTHKSVFPHASYQAPLSPVVPLPPPPCLPAMDPTLKPILVLVTLFLSSLSQAGAGGEFQPVGGAEYRVVKGLGAQKVSEPFQMCLACKCCASGSAADCASMSCCFGINCNLPDKPYGVCAFVPMLCNCSSCAA